MQCDAGRDLLGPQGCAGRARVRGEAGCAEGGEVGAGAQMGRRKVSVGAVR